MLDTSLILMFILWFFSIIVWWWVLTWDHFKPNYFKYCFRDKITCGWQTGRQEQRWPFLHRTGCPWTWSVSLEPHSCSWCHLNMAHLDSQHWEWPEGHKTGYLYFNSFTSNCHLLLKMFSRNQRFPLKLLPLKPFSFH